MDLVKGIVEKGENRGKSIGFPTVNINTSSIKKPDGVYAVLVKTDRKILKGVANLGMAPTFGRKERFLEVHLFDFAENLYGKEIEVFFVKFIREEKKFPSAKDLIVQIQKDYKIAKEIFNK